MRESLAHTRLLDITAVWPIRCASMPKALTKTTATLQVPRGPMDLMDRIRIKSVNERKPIREFVIATLDKATKGEK